MAVTENVLLPHSRKRKRRRRQDKPSISARLVLDTHVKGDVGILSEDLFLDLFSKSQNVSLNGEDSPMYPDFQHVAIAPWTPSTLVDDGSWTIVPVRTSSALAHSTIQFSPSSPALQLFTQALQRISPSKLLSHSRSGIEVRVLDVVPLVLDTIFVEIEDEHCKRLENGEGTFHSQHPQRNVNGAPKPAHSPGERLTAGVREGLTTLNIVHAGDAFDLPLAPHPITHLPPPPAKVTLCEPVAQGVLSQHTRIVVTRLRHHSKDGRKAQSISLNRGLGQVGDEDDDTANDQFYSAAEDRYKTDAAVEDGADDTVTETETELSGADNDDLSDDSMDEMISLQVPMLPASNPSGMSTIQPGSPMTLGRGRRTNGIATPGSVFSTMTAATLRPGGQGGGRLFKAQGLMTTLTEELLHPKPAPEDDEEARVFVDTNSLTKIGCFSGDWVRMETAKEPPAAGSGLWGLGSFGNIHDDGDVVWRPVKVYGLPENYSQRSVTKIPGSKQPEGRRLSFFESQIQKAAHPVAHLSPILLANMESPPYLRLSPLRRGGNPNVRSSQFKITAACRPPCARELQLLKITTPLATERQLENSCIAALRQHFKEKSRIVKAGDLIGLSVDEELGRTLYEPSATPDDLTAFELVTGASLDSSRSKRSSKNAGVVWFKVGHVLGGKGDGDDQVEDEDAWGGVASIDPSTTLMRQSGSEKARLPPVTENSWEYYLQLKKVPNSGSDDLVKGMPQLPRDYVTPLRRRLRELMAAATSPRAIHLKLPPLAILLVSTQRSIGKTTVTKRSCADIGLHTFTIDAFDILSEGGAGGGDTKTEGLLKARAERAMYCGSHCCALLIRHLEALTADRMHIALKEVLAETRVLVATTTQVDKIPDGVRGIFTHELEMSAPDEGEREGILRSIIGDQGIPLSADVDLSAVAVKTAALVAGDLVDVVDRALVARQSRVEALAAKSTSYAIVTTRDVLVSGGEAARCLTSADFTLAVDAARKNFADAIGAPKIPNVSWNDVGGLTNVKDAVMETIQLPLERPELFAKGMKKRSGILFYGPPGTGKTLLAKAIATEFSLNFFSVKGPELLNMYIGESEANVRRIFQRARDARPCVVFFDELDSVAPKRGNQGDSGGVMDRIVSQLLAELDGMSDGEDGGGGVFVIGATNRPDLLDAALLRPGRFDKMLYLGVSDTHEKQLTIMEALTRKFTLSPNLSLPRVASTLPFTYTGADFYALCSDAMLQAITRLASTIDSKVAAINSTRSQQSKPPISTAYYFDHYATDEDVRVVVEEQDFTKAKMELVPSVSAKELEHYARVRKMFEGSEMKGNGQEAASKDGRTVPVPQWEGQGLALPPVRSASGSKGKGRAISSSASEGKGKGKAIAVDSEEDRIGDADMDEDGYGANGRPRKDKGKGKGKAVDTGFVEDEDEDLYG